MTVHYGVAVIWLYTANKPIRSNKGTSGDIMLGNFPNISIAEFGWY